MMQAKCLSIDEGHYTHQIPIHVPYHGARYFIREAVNDNTVDGPALPPTIIYFSVTRRSLIFHWRVVDEP